MFDPCEEGDSKAGFYYDIMIVIGLLYIAFVAFLIIIKGFWALADIGFVSSMFVIILVYIDVQWAAEVIVPHYGWIFSKKDFRHASAFLLISFFLIPAGYYLLTSGIAAMHPIIFLSSLVLMVIPALLGMTFALSCYIDIVRRIGWKKDKYITQALLKKHSYFYRKIHKPKAAHKNTIHTT